MAPLSMSNAWDRFLSIPYFGNKTPIKVLEGLAAGDVKHKILPKPKPPKKGGKKEQQARDGHQQRAASPVNEVPWTSITMTMTTTTTAYQYPAWATAAIPTGASIDWSSIPPAFRPEGPLKTGRSLTAMPSHDTVPTPAKLTRRVVHQSRTTPEATQHHNHQQLETPILVLIVFAAVGVFMAGILIIAKCMTKQRLTRRREVMTEQEWFNQQRRRPGGEYARHELPRWESRELRSSSDGGGQQGVWYGN